MVKYSENEVVSITDFIKQINNLIHKIKTDAFEKIGIVRDNHLEVVVISTKEYERLKQIEEETKQDNWTYWKDEELDNFGKIAIGLTLNDYDNEDYSKW